MARKSKIRHHSFIRFFTVIVLWHDAMIDLALISLSLREEVSTTYRTQSA
eukprot:CCRYP_017940-RC/>CCRYP_017940-RC protein AED:0.46 eAED:0.46 QI:21/1/1/1/0/0/2/132/49